MSIRGAILAVVVLVLAGCGSAAHVATARFSAAPVPHVLAHTAARHMHETPAEVITAELEALSARAASYGPQPTYEQIETFAGYESTALAGTGNSLPEAVQAGALGTDLTDYQDAIAQLYDDMSNPGAANQVVLEQDRQAADNALGALASQSGTPADVVKELS
jgi:hypothetical protein